MNEQHRIGRGVKPLLFGTGIAAVLVAGTAAAQPTPTSAPVTTPVPAASTAAPAAGTAGASSTAASTPDAKTVEAKPDPLVAGLSKQPGGMSLDEVAKMALKSNTSLRVKEAELKQAAARVDQAYVNYFPRVSASFTYARLSEVNTTLPVTKVGTQVAGSVGTLVDPNQTQPSQVVTAPCQQNPAATCVYAADPADPTKVGSPLFAQASQLAFPQVLDTFSFTAQIAVPVSDYLLRISQGHAAASHNEKAKKLDVEAQTLNTAADAKVAYLNWVRAKGQLVVAREAVALATAHVEDVKRLKLVGLLSQADVLRGDAQVAAAQQGAAEVEAFASIAEEVVRTGLGLPKDKALAVGIDVFAVSPPASLMDLASAQALALEKRLEIRALDETELSLKEVDSVTRAGMYPRVDAFADLTIANPNQRYIFAGAEWNTTWDAGVRVSWTFNDTFQTIGAAAESKARITQIQELKKQLRDGLRLEVTAAWTEMKKSAFVIDAANRGLVAAEEGLRVRRELFLLGKATNVEMLDSETEVTRARLRKLDAQMSLLVAQIKFDHAIGNDVGSVKPGTTTAPASGDDASVKKGPNVASISTSDAPVKVPPPMLPLAK
ncbi:MAG: TolC family protein [Polyangiaceae bacterium]|nr:TolC family protein [Polyangiaceae bacterium]